jgi:hypothetical protein
MSHVIVDPCQSTSEVLELPAYLGDLTSAMDVRIAR